MKGVPPFEPLKGCAFSGRSLPSSEPISLKNEIYISNKPQMSQDSIQQISSSLLSIGKEFEN